MIKTLSMIFFGSVLLLSCSLGTGTSLYPKLHLVAIYGKVAPAMSDATFLNWGDKLIYLNQIYTNTNRARQYSYFYFVRNAIDNKTGYVDMDNVVKDPVNRAVILANAIAYEMPTMMSRNKQTVQAPVLAYVTEIKDGEWAKLEPYNAPAKYTLTNDVTALMPVSFVWVSLKDMTTNRGDVDVLIALQLATMKYNVSKKIYDTTPDAKNLQVFQDTIKPEVENIKKMLLIYPQLNPAVNAEVQNFLNVAAPEVSGGSESSGGATNDTTPPTQEEL